VVRLVASSAEGRNTKELVAMLAQTSRPRPAIGIGTWLTALASWLAAILLCSPVSAASAQVAKAINPGAIAWSPDGRRILYADPNGLWATTPPDFRYPVELVRWHSSVGSDISQILWSPDGKRFAFIAQRPGDDWDTVWIANADGSQLHDGVPVGSPITAPGGSRAFEFEAWLDNQRIALAMGCGTGFVCHYIANVESGEAGDLCSSSGPLFWSADRQVAVIQNNPTMGCTGQGLGLVHARSAMPMRSVPQLSGECESSFAGCLDKCCETSDRFLPFFNEWQPLGPDNLEKYVLYTEQLDHGSNLRLWETGTEQRPTLVANAHDGQWSPDGKETSFILEGEPVYDLKGRLTGARAAKSSHLAVMQFNDRRFVALTVPLTSVAWSPASDALAGIGNDHALYVWSPNISKAVPRKLKDRVSGFSWSPDGRWIAATGPAEWISVASSDEESVLFPPVGSDEFNLSDAIVMNRYFQRVIPRAKSMLSECEFRLAYAQALTQVGEIEDAAAQYQKLLLLSRKDPIKVTGEEMGVDSNYQQFAERWPEYAHGRSFPPSESAHISEPKLGALRRMPGVIVFPRVTGIEGVGQTKDQLQVESLEVIGVR